MIKMLRIDDRLLHGQVVFIWSKQLDIKGIVVANDALPDDPIQSMAMKMVVPEHIKLLIKKVDDAVHFLNDPRIEGMGVMVVVKDPEDAARVMKGLHNPNVVQKLNIGNSGRVDKGDRQKLTPEVYVDQTDIEALKELLQYQIPFEIQMIPTNGKTDVKDALSHYHEADTEKSS